MGPRSRSKYAYSFRLVTCYLELSISGRFEKDLIFEFSSIPRSAEGVHSSIYRAFKCLRPKSHERTAYQLSALGHPLSDGKSYYICKSHISQTLDYPWNQYAYILEIIQ